MQIARALLLLALVIGMFAAQASELFGGRFAFTNTSKTELWVNIYGFERDPPCGILSPGKVAGSFMGPMSLPKQATIIWSEGHFSYTDPKAKQFTNIVALSSVSNCPPDATIVFEFTSNKVWRASCEKK